jgi:serine phosphatase RsbU (regulator of sigma subunit)
MMEIEVAVAKVGKYASRESGDTFEVIERPHGGLSFVLADGQRSGRGAKSISNIVARKAIALLAEGVRDGVVARAAHDYLYTHRAGQVISTLNMVSLDLMTRTVVIARNNPSPVYVADPGGIRALDEPSQPIGVHRNTKPHIAELPIEPNTYIVVFTDGIDNAGVRYGETLDLPTLITQYVGEGAASTATPHSARGLADLILARAIELDQGRPGDDMSIVVLAVVSRRTVDGARRMDIHFPLDE